MTGELLTVPEAADRLESSPVLVRNLIKRGELPACKVGRLIRVNEDDVEAIFRGTREPMSGAVLDTKEAARKLKCSVWLVRQLIKRGELPAHRIGRLIRINEADLDKALRLNRPR